MNDKIVSIIRTAVPAAVGSLLAWLISKIPAVSDIIVWLGENAGVDVQKAVSLAATAGVIVGYYALVRFLSPKFPWLEALLGSKKTPEAYTPVPKK